jgi:hypothetical protein
MDDPIGHTPEELERGDDRALHVPVWGCVALLGLLGAISYSLLR